MTKQPEDQDTTHLVVVNDEGQYALWRSFTALPAGWTAVHGPGGRRSCLDHVEANWTDMRPKSLVEAAAGGAA
ncbi:MbtH family protein [Streptomyces sp. NPDC048506]|uniref:MbtH family protein n=1 Tax=Streptomyces sp. NPDC048506 TaxID=3155028 RepID=UPI003432E57E